MALISSMSAGWPYSETGMMARVRDVIAASIREASMLQVSGSMSTNTGVAPSSTMTSAVAMKENGVVITSSPGPTPSAISAISKRFGTGGDGDAVLARRYRRPGGPPVRLTSGPMMYWP